MIKRSENVQRIIVPTGYMGSGSSAITDLVSEFNGCIDARKNYEYVLLHCPNGLFDLEDKLLIGNNALRSDEAIRSFKEQMQKLDHKKYWWVGNYKKTIGPHFMEYTNDFIENITGYQVDNFWYPHEEVNTKMFLKLLIEKPFKLLGVKFKKVTKYKDGMYLSYISAKDFYKYAKEYVSNVVRYINNDNDNIILDQFLLPHNLYRVDNYFDDSLKVIVVDRDPRDVFVLNKYIWQDKQVGVPFPMEAEEFCKFYKEMRESEKKTHSNKILRIHFEDLIYNYDKEIKKIMHFLDYQESDHLIKKERFNPDLSIRNTQIFRDKKYAEEVKTIESELKDYLYHFPYELDNDIKNTREYDVGEV